jgi:hypothetical protein
LYSFLRTTFLVSKPFNDLLAGHMKRHNGL